MKKEHKYGMRQRGYSLGCQPMNGLIRREDSTDGVYWDILVYEHELTERECQQYGLDDLTKEELNRRIKSTGLTEAE